MKTYTNLFTRIISLENLFTAWQEFRLGKKKRPDVVRYEFSLEENIFRLHELLATQQYRHGPYHGFYIHDPKQRHIHKAEVQDRLVHHAVFRVLEPLFEPTFIGHSYSCRKNKGTHKGIDALDSMLRTVSRNNSRSCFVLKCDIQKFFYSVDHDTLLHDVFKRIIDPDAQWLISEIVHSFPHGLPIGNLTSQLFANVYLNRLDQFIKHELRIPHYVRYADDFVIIHNNIRSLRGCLQDITLFLSENLKLKLHPNKVSIRKYSQGVDFLGYVQFPSYRLLRTKTKHRILTQVEKGITEPALHSYLGVLSHCNGKQLSDYITNEFWFKQA